MLHVRLVAGCKILSSGAFYSVADPVLMGKSLAAAPPLARVGCKLISMLCGVKSFSC